MISFDLITANGLSAIGDWSDFYASAIALFANIFFAYH